MNKFTRRDFLRTSLATTASLSLVPAWAAEGKKKKEVSAASQTAVAGANSDLRYAVVGFGTRGGAHLSGMGSIEGARLVALCDVDSKSLEREMSRCEKKGSKVEGYTDIRKLVENKDIDIVTFATPNHWHALGAIWAVQAGKDVYLEKPVSHNVWEGRQIIAAARKYDKIVQTGTQSRSSRHGIYEAILWLREGHIGKIVRARALCYKRRESIGKVDGPQPVPETVDYDLWCGPAPKEPLMRKKLHYDWHWVWPTGNGDLGNQGIHQMDIARWVLGETELSPRIMSVGGRVGYLDDGTTPNTLIVMHEYKTAPLIFEVRGLPTEKHHGAGVGVLVECEDGHVLIPDYTSAQAFDKEGKELKSFKGTSSHFQNFVDAVRSRKHTDLHADIAEGHLSSALCHTGNISYRLGQTQSPDEIRDALKNNKDLGEAYGRMQEHMAANKVDYKATPLKLGVPLTMDPKTERFTGNSEANKMLTREYRKPYVVPEKV